MSEVLVHLAVMNLFGGAAVAAVMALRLPVRRLSGARVAYGLWALAPLAALALLLPARVVVLTAPAPVAQSVIMAPPAARAQRPPRPETPID